MGRNNSSQLSGIFKENLQKVLLSHHWRKCSKCIWISVEPKLVKNKNKNQRFSNQPQIFSNDSAHVNLSISAMVWSLGFTLFAPYAKEKEAKGVRICSNGIHTSYSDVHAPSHCYTNRYTLVRKEEAAWTCQAGVSGLIIWEIWSLEQIPKCAFFCPSFFLWS